MGFWTGKGDDGTTGLFFGGRVRKDDPAPEAYGAVDEAQAALGLARAEVAPGSEADTLLRHVERDLYVLMAELATLPANRGKLEPGRTLVTRAMVDAVDALSEDLTQRFEMPSDFVLPGESRVSAALEVARTVVRRAERASVSVAVEGSHAVAYLNRLSSLVWAMARWQEAEHPLARAEPGLSDARPARPAPGATGPLETEER